MAEYDADEVLTDGEDGALLKKFSEWDKNLEAHYGEWIDEAKECFNYVACKQYSKTEKKQLEDNKRPDAVFNRIGPIIDACVGAVINAKQETKYLPRTNDDTGFNEFLTRGAEYIRDEGEAEYEEMRAKRDAFICGHGWINCKLEYDDDPKGLVLYDRLNPWECLADPSSRKANYRDARYIRWRRSYTREEFEDMWPGAMGIFEDSGDVPTYSSNPRHSYEGDDGKRKDEDEVTVSLYQWIDTISISLVQTPEGGTIEVPAEDFERLRMEDEEAGNTPPQSQTIRRKRYRWAFTSGKEILDQGELSQKKFTLLAVTGKYDEEDGVYYGLVRPMKDPQMWANTFFNMILHIIRTNAKGGLMAEEGAVVDVRTFEESWAKSDSISWLTNGALAQGRIQQKTAPTYPATISDLLDRAVEAIRETSGVNAEILGLADRDQPGVLEAQRKQAAYGILADFFDSFTRYNKAQGELLIEYMRAMEGKIVRVSQESGVEQYAPLLRDQLALEYDVIVDEAPAGPNQKQQTFAVIQAMLPILRDADLPLDVWMELLQYSPLPETLVQKIIQRFSENAQADPEEQRQAIIANMLQLANMHAEVRNKESDADKKDAETEKTKVQAQSEAIEAINLARNPDPRPQSNL